MRPRTSATGIQYGDAFPEFERQHYIELLTRTWVADPHRLIWAGAATPDVLSVADICKMALVMFDQTTGSLAQDRHGPLGHSPRDHIKPKHIEQLNKDAARALLQLTADEWTAWADRIQADDTILFGTPPWFDHNTHGEDPSRVPWWARNLISDISGTPRPAPPMP